MHAFLLFISLFSPAIPHPITPQIIAAHAEKEGKAIKASRTSAVYITPIESHGHGTGTYVQIDDDFFVITARHVVKEHKRYFVNAGDEASIGSKIYESKKKDIAVLRVAKMKTRKAIILDKACSLKIGETVYFSGFPSHYSLMTTRAFVSGEVDKNLKYLQGLAWFGSSGSGTVNNHGELCAVVTAIATEQRGFFVHALESLNYIHTITMNDILDIRKAIVKEKTP